MCWKKYVLACATQTNETEIALGKMRHIICFSGGKDSTALICWAKENLAEFDTVFCDTGWEHPLTYAYIEEINQKHLGGKLITIKSDKYSGFEDMAVQRNMVPGVKSRFCTQELKIFPLHKFYDSIDDEVTSYQGIRADESHARSKMGEEEWCDDAGGYLMKRPLYHWTAEQCFELAAKHQIEPNPLYLLGAKRVGCWPCIMIGHVELKYLFANTPGLLERLQHLEDNLNSGREEKDFRNFFRTDFIPQRFCSKSVITKDGRTVRCPTAKDVYDYIYTASLKQLELLDNGIHRSCVSHYNLCE